jgi:hypothetical protein
MLAALLLPALLPPGIEPPADAVKLNEPRVQMRNNEASATRSPWIDANGWRILRTPAKKFVYHVKGEAAALAAAEAFTYGTDALISTDAAGEAAFAKMLAFLKTLPAVDLNPVADFGVVDDGSDLSGELLNLVTRMNLLCKIEKTPDRAFRLNVQIGTKEYPKEDARNPSILAHKIRSQIGDENRSLRIYGTEVVVARLLASPEKARVLLLNYSLVNYSNRPVLGMRVRVRGAFAKGDPHAFALPAATAADWTTDGPATEFSIPELRTFAVVDLQK